MSAWAPTSGGSRSPDEVVEFGFIPQRLVQQLRNTSDWQSRADGIKQVKDLVAGLYDADPILPHFPALMKLLIALSADANFRVSLTAFELISDIIEKVGGDIRPFLSSLVTDLVERLGDNKIATRQAALKVVFKLMLVASAKSVMTVLLGHVDNKNWHVREEVLTCVAHALLKYPREELPFPRLATVLLNAMDDTSERVASTAVECLALLHSVVGETRMHTLTASAGPAQQHLLAERFALRQLPTLARDGLVEFPSVSMRTTMTAGLDEPFYPAGPAGSAPPSSDPSPPPGSPTLGTSPLAAAAGAPPPVPRIFGRQRKPGKPAPIPAPGGGGSNGPTPTPGPGSGSSDGATAMWLQDDAGSGSGSGSGSAAAGAAAASAAAGASGTDTPRWVTPPHGADREDDASSGSDEGGAVGSRPGSKVRLWLPEPFTPRRSLEPPPRRLLPARSPSGPVPGRVGASSPASGVSDEYNEWVTDDVHGSSGEFGDDYDNQSRISEQRALNTNRLSLLKQKVGLFGPKRAASAVMRLGGSGDDDLGSALAEPSSEPPRRRLLRPFTETGLLGDSGGSDPGPAAGPAVGYGGLGTVPSTAPAGTKPRLSAATMLRRQRLAAQAASEGRSSLSSGGLGTPEDDEGSFGSLGRQDSGELLGAARRTPVAARASVEPPSSVNADVKTLADTEILPADNAEAEYRRAVQLYKRGDKPDTWGDMLESVVACRRLVLHHDAVVLPNLHQVVAIIMAGVNHIRSAVSKSGMLGVKALFRLLRRSIDTELEAIVPSLMNKVAERNFLADEAIEALKSMCDNVSETRACAVLLAQVGHKNPVVRTQVAERLDQLIARMGPRIYVPPEKGALEGRRVDMLDKLLPVLANLLNEGLVETRAATKRALYRIHQALSEREPDLFDRMAARILPAPALQRVREAVESMRTKGADVFASLPRATPSRKGTPLAASFSGSSSQPARMRSPTSAHSATAALPPPAYLGAGMAAPAAAAGSGAGARPMPAFAGSVASASAAAASASASAGSAAGGASAGAAGLGGVIFAPLPSAGPARPAASVGGAFQGSKPLHVSGVGPAAGGAAAASAGGSGAAAAATAAGGEDNSGTFAIAGRRASRSLYLHGRVGSASSGAGASAPFAAAAAVGAAAPLKEPPEFETLPQLYIQMASSDWRARHDAIEHVVALVTQYPAESVPKLPKVFDSLSSRLGDVNSKVAMFALQGVQKLLPILGNDLECVLHVLVPQLANNLAASNDKIRTLTSEVVDTLTNAVDHTALLPAYASVVAHGAPRVRAAMLQKLHALLATVYARRPALLAKHLLPTCFRLLDEPKAETRQANNALLLELHHVMGDQLLEYATEASDAAQAKLRDVLALRA